WAPAILLEAEGWYSVKPPRQEGATTIAPPRQGWRLFSISGHVENPGVYEMAVDDILEDLIRKAGGIKDGKTLKAIRTSGPSGGFLPPTLPLKRDGLKERLEEASRTAKTPYIPRFFEKYLTTAADASIDVCTFPLDLNFFRDVGKVFGLEWTAAESGL